MSRIPGIRAGDYAVCAECGQEYVFNVPTDTLPLKCVTCGRWDSVEFSDYGSSVPSLPSDN